MSKHSESLEVLKSALVEGKDKERADNLVALQAGMEMLGSLNPDLAKAAHSND